MRREMLPVTLLVRAVCSCSFHIKEPGALLQDIVMASNTGRTVQCSSEGCSRCLGKGMSCVSAWKLHAEGHDVGIQYACQEETQIQRRHKLPKNGFIALLAS